MTSTTRPSAAPTRPAPTPGGRVPARPPGGRATATTTAAAPVGIVALCGALAAATLLPDQLDRVAVPVALIGVVLGIPHGAVDHMVPFWATGTRPRSGALARGLSVYLLVAAVAAAALVVAPVPVVIAFLVASALHFGRGEIVFAAERAGRPVPAVTSELPAVLAHGAVVVGLPVTLWHDRAAPVLDVLAPGLGRPLPHLALTGAAAAVVVAALVVAGRALHQHRVREATELLLVLAVFVVVPPLVAFGVYFGAWHAVRHTGRLLALPGPHGPLPFGAALRRYLVHAAAPTAVALAALVVAQHVVTAAALPVALAVLLALTFPHLQTVARLDRLAAGTGRRRSADAAAHGS